MKEIVKIMNPDGSTYEGEMDGDFRSGTGILRLTDGTTYEGVWTNDQMINGKIVFPDGNWYEGQLSDNQYSGAGIFHWKDGGEYSGSYSKGEFDGQGTLKTSKGTTYIGEFKNGTYNGKGCIIRNNGEKIVATFKDGLPIDNVEVHTDEGSLISGEYRNWRFIGEITIRYPNKDVFVGNASGYMPNGPGKITKENGITYQGIFVNGELEGTVSKILKDGTEVRGEFEKWEIMRSASIRYTNGNRYEGPIQDDIPNGVGNYFDRYGNRYSGLFVKGKPRGAFKITTTGDDCITGLMEEVGIIENTRINYKNGDIYEGRTVYCKPEGYGRYQSRNYYSYTGFFKEGLFTGKGMLVTPEMKYEGAFINGEIYGEGTYTFGNGNVAAGVFDNAPINNSGVYRWGDKQKSLDPKYNKNMVRGTIKLNNGLVYSGDFESSTPNGKGRLVYKGVVYESEHFVNLSIEGEGKAYFKDGSVFEGLFRGLNEAEGELITEGKRKKCILSYGERKLGVSRRLYNLSHH